MISAARNIRDNAEALVKMPLKHVYDALRNPRPNITTMLNQIRVARALDPSRYPALKSQLPYFVCAIFNPPYRRSANFAYPEYFIIDIDHISEKALPSKASGSAYPPTATPCCALYRPEAMASKWSCSYPKNATTQGSTKYSTKRLPQLLHDNTILHKP